MKMNTVWTVIGVVVAVVIAWWLVDLLAGMLFFAFKLAIVAAVAFVVFLALRALFSRGDRGVRS